MANGVDPDVTAHHEPSFQDLHSVQKWFWSTDLKGIMLMTAIQFTFLVSNCSIHVNPGPAEPSSWATNSLRLEKILFQGLGVQEWKQEVTKLFPWKTLRKIYLV